MKMHYYDTGAVSMNEYNQIRDENQRLRNAIYDAKNLARNAWHNQNIEDFQYDVAEIERILEVV